MKKSKVLQIMLSANRRAKHQAARELARCYRIEDFIAKTNRS